MTCCLLPVPVDESWPPLTPDDDAALDVRAASERRSCEHAAARDVGEEQTLEYVLGSLDCTENRLSFLFGAATEDNLILNYLV